jgi:hypothetical protein
VLTRISVVSVSVALPSFLLAGLAARPCGAQELSASAVREMRAMLAEKASRTPAQRKMATSLLMAQRNSRGEAMVQGLHALPRVAARAGVDGAGMVVVDIRAIPTETLLRTIADVGGQVVSSYPSYQAVRARVPVRRLDDLAALPEVGFIRPKAKLLVFKGSVTSEGDVAHAAAAARGGFGIDGSGVKVGVLSDGVDSLAGMQGTGDLPPNCPAAGACVTVVPGQAGSGDEGTAMLEIIYDLAPGAKLFFATADGGPAAMATNIQTLRSTYGCDIIIDDGGYPDEGAFQDGPIAQAVSAVTSQGALYFAAAGNSGNMDAGTSGTWEGDFKDSGTDIPAIDDCCEGGPGAVLVHTFNGLTGGSAANSDELTADASDYITLKWANPLGAATEDYDLFLLDSTLTTVWDASYDYQVGCPSPPPISPPLCTSEPLEIIGFGLPSERIVVVKWPGSAPTAALRVDTLGGGLTFSTAGAIFGHSGAASAISVAAANAGTAGGGAFTGGSANPVATYSSDGPRRMFFNPNGSAITPGNVLFGTNGGRVLQKPDVTAADCVSVATPTFTPFCGTSAAAAHAGAIAALLKSAPNNPSGGQALAALFANALDVDPAGRDRDSGVGIVMANSAANALINVPSTSFYTLNPCRAVDTRLVSGPTGGAQLTCGIEQRLTIVGGTCPVPASAKAVSLNVTATAPSAAGNVRLFASGAPAPQVSNLNYTVGQTRANNAVAPLSASGELSVLCSPSGKTHVIIDVNGYFQ